MGFSSIHLSINSTISQSINLLRSFNREKGTWQQVSFNGRRAIAFSCLNVDVKSSGKSIGEIGAVKASKEVMEAEAKVMVGTYARAPLVLASGKVYKLFDVEGREYLDMTSGIAVNALGHCDLDWVKAVVEQANALTHVINVYYSIPQVELAKRLVDYSFADRVFFTNSGTEANEAAIKFAKKKFGTLMLPSQP